MKNYERNFESVAQWHALKVNSDGHDGQRLSFKASYIFDFTVYHQLYFKQVNFSLIFTLT